MLTINLEVRQANSMEDVYEHKEILKQDALFDGINMGLEAYYQKYPSAQNAPYAISPSEIWNGLPDTLFLFKENPSSERGICYMVKHKVLFPMAIAAPIYILFESGLVENPLEINVMPTMADTFK